MIASSGSPTAEAKDEAEPGGNGRAGSIIICGLGTLGARVAELLAADHAVTILSRGHEERFRHVTSMPGVSLIDADFLQREVLERTGLPRARALLALCGDDFANLAVALLARELCPDLPLLVRLSDPIQAASLGRHLPNAVGLSVPSLAAPMFGVAAYRAGHHSAQTRDLLPGNVFLIGEHPWLAASETIAPSRRAGGDLVARPPMRVEDLERQRGVVVVAWRSGSDSRSGAHDRREALPAPERQLEPSGDVLLVGPWEAVTGQAPRAAEVHGWHWQGLFDRPRAFFRRVRPAAWTVLAVLTLVIAANTLLFTLTYGLTPLDALYFVVSTITTVGYGDITFHNASAPLKLYGVLLMLLGVLLMASVYAFVTDYLVGSRLDDLLGERPLPRRGHVVVCGLGTVGYRTAQMLRSMGESVVVVDTDADHRYARRARQEGIPLVIGDAVTAETLARANVSRARCLVAATSEDRVNLAIALAARDASADVAIVLRLFDGSLVGPVRVALGIDDALSAAEPAARAFALAAHLGPAYRASLDGLGSDPVHVVETQVPAFVDSQAALASWLRMRAKGERLRVLADRSNAATESQPRRASRGRASGPDDAAGGRIVTVATTARGARALLAATLPTHH